MKYLFMLFFLCSFSFNAHSETLSSDSNSPHQIWYTFILNNIFEYRACNKINDKQRIYNPDFLYEYKNDDGYHNLEINKDYQLSIDTISFPRFDSLFKFYEYTFDWGYFKTVVIHPKDTLYNKHLYNRVDFDCDSLVRKQDIGAGGLGYLRGIVAEIKVANDEKCFFISGEMFLDDVKEILFKDTLYPELIKDYILLKYYNYHPDSIQVTEEIKGKVYSAIFKSNEKKIFVLIKKSNYIEYSRTKKKYIEIYIPIYGEYD